MSREIAVEPRSQAATLASTWRAKVEKDPALRHISGAG